MQYANERKTYRTFIKSGSQMRALIQSNLKNGALPDGLVDALAQEHAQCYQCAVERNADGAYRFKDSKGERHGSAQQQWSRTIDPYHKRARSNRGGARNKQEQVTPRKTKRVTELLVMFNDLSAAERAAFLEGAK